MDNRIVALIERAIEREAARRIVDMIDAVSAGLSPRAHTISRELIAVLNAGSKREYKKSTVNSNWELLKAQKVG